MGSGNLVYYIVIYRGHRVLFVTGYGALACGCDERDNRYIQNFDGKHLGKCPPGKKKWNQIITFR
jgi:hypothetical protein